VAGAVGSQEVRATDKQSDTKVAKNQKVFVLFISKPPPLSDDTRQII